LIDVCADAGETAGAQRALQQCERLKESTVRSRTANRRCFYYFEANAWSLLRKPEVGNRDAAWTWQESGVRQRNPLLRMTLRSPGFIVWSPQRRSQIYTNLANALEPHWPVRRAIGSNERAVDGLA